MRGKYCCVYGKSGKQKRAMIKNLLAVSREYPKRIASEVSKAIQPVIQPEGRGDESTTTLQFAH